MYRVFVRNRVAGVALAVALSMVQIGCPAASDSTTAYCGKRLIIPNEAILHAGMPIEIFAASTPAAKNDCDAHFQFSVQWADPARATADSLLPPLMDLTNAFRANGDSAIFSHPAIARTNTAGFWMWELNFDASNKTSSKRSTEYGVATNIDPLLQHGPEDSVKVSCQIVYSPI